MTERLVHWWHYTTGAALAEIIASGAIQRSGDPLIWQEGNRRAVWFSCRETWEPTAALRIEHHGLDVTATATLIIKREASPCSVGSAGVDRPASVDDASPAT